MNRNAYVKSFDRMYDFLYSHANRFHSMLFQYAFKFKLRKEKKSLNFEPVYQIG